MGKIKSKRADMLLLLLEKFVNQSILQFNRIKESLEKSTTDVLPTLFSDCHFYFISINKVSELIFKFYDVTGFDEIIIVLEKNKKFFNEYNKIRNHYEHIEERTTSIKKEFDAPRRYLHDFGNIYGKTYTFGGDSYDISDNSIEVLGNIYNEIVRIVNSHCK